MTTQISIPPKNMLLMWVPCLEDQRMLSCQTGSIFQSDITVNKSAFCFTCLSVFSKTISSYMTSGPYNQLFKLYSKTAFFEFFINLHLHQPSLFIRVNAVQVCEQQAGIASVRLALYFASFIPVLYLSVTILSNNCTISNASIDSWADRKI